jgi:hypothetical protein
MFVRPKLKGHSGFTRKAVNSTSQISSQGVLLTLVRRILETLSVTIKNQAVHKHRLT